jgi:TonB family protein
MNFIHYLLQVNLYLLLFYGFYRFVLRNETFHHLNRTYLVGSATMAFFIPVLQSDWLKYSAVTIQVSEQLYSYYNPQTIILRAVRPQEPMFTWGHLCAILYIIGIIFFLGKLAFQVAHLQRFLSRRRSAKQEAFAFFNFWRVSTDLAHRDTIIAHEQVHVKQLHSADVLLFELIAIFNWFNPIVYAYKQSIKNTHEFLADQVASRHHGDLAGYAMLLFSQQFGVSKVELTHQFFDKITLKRRIAMLSKPKSTPKALIKYGFVAPLFGAMLIISSSAISESRSIERLKEAVSSEKPVFELKTTSKINAEPTVSVQGHVLAMQASGKTKPLANVAIRIPDVAKGAFTNLEGYYKIVGLSLDDVEALTASFDGFVVKQANAITLGKGFQKDFILTNAASGNAPIAKASDKLLSTNLSEMVVVAYGAKSTLATVPATKAAFAAPRPKEGVFNVVDVLPEYDGGVNQFYKVLAQHIIYPKTATRAGVEGKTYTTFIVEKDGTIGDIEIVRSIGFGCDEAIKKAIEQSAKWTPGQINGQNVAVQFTLPVVFELENNNSSNDEIVKLPEINANFKVINKPIEVDKQGAVANKQTSTNNVVFLSFSTDKNGKIENTEVLKSLGPDYDSEAIRIIKAMTDLKPAKAKYTIPVRFNANNQDTQDPQEDEVFSVVEQQPTFKQGQQALYKYLNENIKYPAAALRANVKGKVFLAMTIDKTGKVTAVKVLKGIGFGCDKEAVRVVESMPLWSPGLQGGKPVNCKYSLPINFDFTPQKYKNGKAVGSQHSVTVPPPPPPPEPPRAPIKGKTKRSAIEEIANPQNGVAIDNVPEFEGGKKGLSQYLARNIKYPKEAQRRNISGTVLLSMFIDKTGKVKDVTALKGIGYGCDEEAIRVVENMPNWKPASNAGKTVEVRHSFPINFTLD